LRTSGDVARRLQSLAQFVVVEREALEVRDVQVRGLAQVVEVLAQSGVA
jgi:hypothetical protein